MNRKSETPGNFVVPREFRKVSFSPRRPTTHNFRDETLKSLVKTCRASYIPSKLDG